MSAPKTAEVDPKARHQVPVLLHLVRPSAGPSGVRISAERATKAQRAQRHRITVYWPKNELLHEGQTMKMLLLLVVETPRYRGISSATQFRMR